MIYTNFYVVAPVAMLNIPLPLGAFLKPIENTDVERYYTIPEYLATYSHTVERFSVDGTMFCKGFGFNIDTLDELRLKMPDYGLVEGTSLFIYNQPEVLTLLATPEWNKVEGV